MDKYLIKNDEEPLSKKRKRSEAFEEHKDDESEKPNASNKKRRVNYAESSDDDDDDEYILSDDDSDFENTNTNNSNSNNNNSNGNSGKDSQIKNLKKKLQAMTEKCGKLKIENIKLKKQIKSTPAKASKGKTEKAIAKMKKKYLKKWATRLPKIAGMKKTKFVGCSKEIVVEEVGFDREDFDALFGDKGVLIQPRPDNKPTSTVIIRRFSSWSSIEAMFKDYGLTEAITVSIWRNRNFSKSRYWGNGEASIDSLSVCYNKSRKVLQLKFQCERDYGGWF